MKFVATNHTGYNSKRNFIDLPYKEFEFKKVMDATKPFSYSYFKATKKTHPYLSNLFYDGMLNYKLFHFFNSVNIGKKPWVNTFECYLPRGGPYYGKRLFGKKYIDLSLRKLAATNCKKLIAMSEFAYQAQLNYLNDYGKLADGIISKTVVIHPSQKLNIEHFSDKETDNRFLSFSMIGGDFFRKGGKEILNVFDRLLSEGSPVFLNVVSMLNYGDYASQSSEEDLNKAKKIINKYNNIKHYLSLPNTEVIQLLKKSDIGLLPSYEESYGYSVLEAQSCGCPVITTDGGALSEINNNSIGWVIGTDKDKDGRSVPRTENARKRISKNIESELYEIIRNLLNRKEEINVKSVKCLDHINRQHNPISAAAKIEEIYRNAWS